MLSSLKGLAVPVVCSVVWTLAEALGNKSEIESSMFRLVARAAWRAKFWPRELAAMEVLELESGSLVCFNAAVSSDSVLARGIKKY